MSLETQFGDMFASALTARIPGATVTSSDDANEHDEVRFDAKATIGGAGIITAENLHHHRTDLDVVAAIAASRVAAVMEQQARTLFAPMLAEREQSLRERLAQAEADASSSSAIVAAVALALLQHQDSPRTFLAAVDAIMRMPR